MSPSQKAKLTRILIALALFVAVYLVAELGFLARQFGETNGLYAEFALFLVPYLIAGYDVILKAFRNIGRGQVFDEDFLMTVATFGAFALVFFPESEPHMAEGAAVMLFFQVGELFQDYAVNKSRKSIADMMDIAPENANVMRDGALVQVDPYELAPGDEFIVKPGERIPLDGIVIGGASQIDTAALTGESIPRHVEQGAEVISGCINRSHALTIQARKPFEESTVSRILELVESAADKKARTENFITRFARYYTPAVVGIAVALAMLPPLLLGQPWTDWIQRGLIFLVVSCPCALVISVPLSFFGGIGGASRLGILVKGSNYLEALASTHTVAFDKTGTLTTGAFSVSHIQPAIGITSDELLRLAAHAEAYSTHPLAQSVQAAYKGCVSAHEVSDIAEISGLGIECRFEGRILTIGNRRLMESRGIAIEEPAHAGTTLHLAIDGSYAGHLVVADIVKEDARRAIDALHRAGVSKIVLLTGDQRDIARTVASELGIDEVRAELLPQDKVSAVEALLAEKPAKTTLAFVGDGINDAPVLSRSDIGIAMGAMGSDAAIEAADIVLMNDRPSDIARAIKLARRTMRIVWQNIVFALGVKFAVLILAAFGLANLWLAVFADVGVAVIAILNAMRAMSTRSLKE